jgi:hypothetical protein
MRTTSGVLTLLALTTAACSSSCGATSNTSPPSAAPGNGGAVGSAPGNGGTANGPGAGSGAPIAGDPVKTPCDLKAKDFVDANHPELGKPVLVVCPSACPGGGIWGTDLYTDDSMVCRALVHAGAIPPAGGKAAITFTRGQLSYISTERNGVGSNSYGSWPRSFYAQAVDAQNRPVGSVPTIYDEHTALVGCGSSNPFQGAPGSRFTAVCTADCVAGGLWGSNPYTGDSSLCAAAHHAGLLKPGELKFSVTLGGPEGSFKGSSANGVNSQSYGAFGSSFTLAKAQ